jgi:hypothetical protein
MAGVDLLAVQGLFFLDWISQGNGAVGVTSLGKLRAENSLHGGWLDFLRETSPSMSTVYA